MLTAMTAPRQATRALALLTAVVVVADVVFVAAAGRTADRFYVGVAVVLAVSTVGLALLVARQRPANVVAPLLAWMGLLAAVSSFSDTYLPVQARRPDLLPELPGVVAAVLVVTWVWLYAAVGLLMLFFPDGRLPGRRWFGVAVGLPAVALAIQVVMAVSPGPYDAPYAAVQHPFGDLPTGLSTGLKIVLFPVVCLLLVACAWSIRTRYTRAEAVRRAQLQWLTLAGLAIPLTILLSWVGFALLGTHSLAGIGFAVLYVAVPVATTIAVLRHDLYDVDRALSATVTYGIGTAVLVVVYAAASFAGGVALGRDSVAVAAAVTAVTALVLAPVRHRLQRAVDRLCYPMRQDARRALEDLRTGIALGRAEPERLEEVLRVALRDPALRIGILVHGGNGYVDLAGEPLDLAAAATPIVVREQQVGRLETHGPASVQLQREVADASALLVETVRLRLELSAALHEVESSRSRLLQIGYDERRRLERDLHDGAQQRLVSLGMALRLAQRHLGDRTVDVDGLLDESVAQLGTAVAELREVAHGLRPSSLDAGLHPALVALAESAALPIELDIEAERAIPDDIAVTTYYVVSEAVANAVKHAEASRIGLRVVHDDGRLRVRISDDGRGGAVVRPGSGLAGLCDRVAAAGGSLDIQSSARAGTVVEVSLPCAS
ncbi:MAG: putative two-component system histidine kinase [Nocardioidaceae bacterium]|nr:putative two-component system histidine kinase [Nocardioidaceae bacterium]